MNPFREFMDFKSNNKISVVLENYEEALLDNIKLVAWQGYIQSNEAEKAAIEDILLTQHYPKVNNFMLALESMNPQKIQAAYQVYQDWCGGSLPEPIYDFKVKALTRSSSALNEQEIVRLLLQKTSQNMHKVGKIVEMTIAKIPRWGSKVVIFPALPEGRSWFDPVEKATVEVHRPPAVGRIGCALLPGGLEIWTMDGNEMFELDEGLQIDHGTLLARLMKPVEAPKRFLTMYFCADLAERPVYKEARRRLSLFGNAEIYPPTMRETIDNDNYIQDVWKVRVDSNYVIETQPQQFESVGRTEIPIKYIELIREGTG
jgi:hypothetical protein